MKILITLILIIVCVGMAFAVPMQELTDPEMALACLINNARIDHGLKPVALNYELVDIARSRSQDMLSRGYFSHYTPEGKNITHILRQNGVYYKNFGELLGRSAKGGTPEAFMEAWLDSYSHRNAILQRCYTDIGVGIVDQDGMRIITVVFIRR